MPLATLRFFLGGSGAASAWLRERSCLGGAARRRCRRRDDDDDDDDEGDDDADDNDVVLVAGARFFPIWRGSKARAEPPGKCAGFKPTAVRIFGCV